MNEITKAILDKNEVGVLSTLDENGAPWATPVHMASDDSRIYWVSNSETNHSRNIARDSRVFITVFNPLQQGELPGQKGALYCATNASELTGEQEVAARKAYYEKYPDRNTERFQEWSIYGASVGQLNEEKTKGPLVYYTERGTIA
jgi:uncharacterized protein YhbP (UPF0306 family)